MELDQEQKLVASPLQEKGGLFWETKPWYTCCGRKTYERRCTIVPRKYQYDKDDRRFHYDDVTRPCYYRNRYLKTVTTVSPEKQLNGKTSVATVSEVHVDERKKTIDKTAKGLPDVWMPHANPLRNINTSTKWTEKDFISDYLCWLQLRHMLYLTLYHTYPCYVPTFEDVEGHIGFGVSVRACVRSWHFLMHAVSYEPCMLGFWNLIYGFLMEK